jgi:ABC-type polysaccharide/polyol phosphate export permease
MSFDSSGHQPNSLTSNLYPTLTEELLGAVRRYRLWIYLAWSDIRQRYRGSVLGPLWITLSTSIFVAALSVINAELFKAPPEKYIPSLTTGFVIWYFISGTLSESTTGLFSSKGLISQISLPFYVHIFRVITRNLLILAHNAIVVFIVLAWFKTYPTIQIFMIFPSILLVSLILLSAGMILAMIGARYRDIQQVVASMLQVLFFVSPITWEAKQISNATWVLHLNPVYYIIDALRSPILGTPVHSNTWTILLLMTATTTAVALWLFNKKRDKIPYWVQ